MNMRSLRCWPQIQRPCIGEFSETNVKNRTIILFISKLALGYQFGSTPIAYPHMHLLYHPILQMLLIHYTEILAQNE